MSEKDDLPFLPTRHGTPMGERHEREQRAQVGPESIRRVQRDNLDGSTTVLHTRGGAFEYVTTKPEPPEEDEVARTFVFNYEAATKGVVSKLVDRVLGVAARIKLRGTKKPVSAYCTLRSNTKPTDKESARRHWLDVLRIDGKRVLLNGRRATKVPSRLLVEPETFFPHVVTTEKVGGGYEIPSADAYPDGESPLFFIFTGRDIRQVTQALRTGGEGTPVECNTTFTGPSHDEKTVEGGVAIGVNKCAFFNQQVVRSVSSHVALGRRYQTVAYNMETKEADTVADQIEILGSVYLAGSTITSGDMTDEHLSPPQIETIEDHQTLAIAGQTITIDLTYVRTEHDYVHTEGGLTFNVVSSYYDDTYDVWIDQGNWTGTALYLNTETDIESTARVAAVWDAELFPDAPAVPTVLYWEEAGSLQRENFKEEFFASTGCIYTTVQQDHPHYVSQTSIEADIYWLYGIEYAIDSYGPCASYKKSWANNTKAYYAAGTIDYLFADPNEGVFVYLKTSFRRVYDATDSMTSSEMLAYISGRTSGAVVEVPDSPFPEIVDEGRYVYSVDTESFVPDATSDTYNGQYAAAAAHSEAKVEVISTYEIDFRGIKLSIPAATSYIEDGYLAATNRQVYPNAAAPYMNQGGCPWIAYTTRSEEADGATPEFYIDVKAQPGLVGLGVYNVHSFTYDGGLFVFPAAQRDYILNYRFIAYGVQQYSNPPAEHVAPRATLDPYDTSGLQARDDAGIAAAQPEAMWIRAMLVKGPVLYDEVTYELINTLDPPLKNPVPTDDDTIEISRV